MQTASKRKETLQRLTARLEALSDSRPALFTAALAAALALALEILGRHSLLRAAAFLCVHPVHFLCNALIVAFTLSVSYLFKRRRFLLPSIAALWLALGIINAVMLYFRVTPLNAGDVLLLPSGLSIMSVYLDWWMIALLALALLGALVWLVKLFYNSPKTAPAYKRAAAMALIWGVLAGGCYGATVWGHEQQRERAYANLMDAYDRYGFVYCLATGVFDRGIGKPDGYSRRTVERLVSGLEPAAEPAVKPDVVMVQLESFFDVAYLDDVIFEEDPIPVFRQLKENYASGFLRVPSMGAGTANTEFEVLSGMNLDFFGMGEYPYMTVLQEQTCETVAADLKNMGYTAHALHNNTGTFYSRDSVFAQLGFDTYTSIEFMNGVEYNPIGWAKDSVLTGEIEKALDSSDDPHFVFAITVQGHGKYQRGVDSQETESLSVTWADDEQEQDALGYYLGQLRETDAFIGDLVRLLQERERPAVLVLYGDHLPNFDIGSDQLKNGDVFQTEYVIWDNMGLDAADGDLCAYQLSARVLWGLGMSGGVLSRYHQQRQDAADYQQGLELLEYDMLYGEYYCCGGKNPYKPSDLRMDVEPLEIDGASWADGVLTLTGRGFTAWSRVTVDGDETDAVPSGDGTALWAEMEQPPEPGAAVTVRQRAENMTALLAESEPYVWPEDAAES